MDVADLREQVVLDLEVEPAQVPGEEAVVAREVDGGLDLVRHPLAFDAPRPIGRDGELGLLDAVGELEHGREREAENRHGHEVEADDREQAMAGEQRDAERQHQEADLARPERDLIPSPRPGDGGVGDAGRIIERKSSVSCHLIASTEYSPQM